MKTVLVTGATGFVGRPRWLIEVRRTSWSYLLPLSPREARRSFRKCS
jgi:hypothetical protein